MYGYVWDTNIENDVFGLISFYRSVNRLEYFDILEFGWRGSSGQMAKKWFADNFEHAVDFGQQLRHGADPKFYVIEVDIPEDIVNRAYRSSGNHDNIGPASCFDTEDLNRDYVKIKSRNSIRADRKQQKLGGCK